MPWTYERNTSLGLVEVFYTGEVTTRELQESTSALIELEKTDGLIRFLVDVTEMRLSSFTSLFDIFNIPAKQYEEEEADRDGRVAVFVPDHSEMLSVVKFYENACVNRGWMVKRFAERQEALEWLISEE